MYNMSDLAYGYVELSNGGGSVSLCVFSSTAGIDNMSGGCVCVVWTRAG